LNNNNVLKIKIMNNEEKARMYHTLLLRHDKLDGLISDIKSEAAGVELNKEQKTQLEQLESQKQVLVKQAMSLMGV
jgi:VIT1/CCC1 family predicted Fe2+/Mn2+ transporter|tara:strand:- start:562 stop:789 length:228 start_codon:yes stop_codon:yes gene_type:complete